MKTDIINLFIVDVIYYLNKPSVAQHLFVASGIESVGRTKTYTKRLILDDTEAWIGESCPEKKNRSVVQLDKRNSDW
jgi:hypothetical protein